ncbi:sulfatase family protein [Pontiella sulfatireligans]|uniref:Arylsulfatase n=1 Tax=Pontiella sulfatireligans TaxID=2750658 RepID=A0A6C2UJ26_9BACT|nr:sulfatase-like hydrolase/transferase [Pontiella sulfatireligans]SPS74293.1 sulfatase S1_N.C [Kiritimatiellales bacterium]VGO19206.1 Arylsulfatase [Pontiella sulfatireligans]
MKILQLIATACVCLGGTTSYSVARPAHQKPNIVFIEVDDLNYKYSGLAEKKLLETPNIDRIAQSGTYFKNAMCQGMMCGPSRNSLISGLYPHSMGFYRNGQMGSFPKGTWMFPQALQKAGYFTSYIGKSHIKGYAGTKGGLGPDLGFDHSQHTAGRAVLLGKAKKGGAIDDWYFNFLQEEGLFETLVADSENKRNSTLAEDAYLDGFFTKATLDFLDGYKAKKPFFLWINYSLPHGPHDVADKYHTFSADDMPGVQKANFTPPEKLVKDTKRVKTDMKETQADYCAATTFMDRQVGRVLENLKKNNMLENTVVVFFSDHGIMMGDHERIHKGTLFRQITTPSLLVSWPKGFKQNTVVKTPVELMDVIPTALELADGSQFDERKINLGESLLPLLTGKGTYERKLAFGEVESYVAVSDGRYRLIRGEGHNLLFDDLNDPDNLTEISEQHPEKTAELAKAVDEWLSKTGPVIPPKGF